MGLFWVPRFICFHVELYIVNVSHGFLVWLVHVELYQLIWGFLTFRALGCCTGVAAGALVAATQCSSQCTRLHCVAAARALQHCVQQLQHSTAAQAATQCSSPNCNPLQLGLHWLLVRYSFLWMSNFPMTKCTLLDLLWWVSKDGSGEQNHASPQVSFGYFMHC